MKNITNIIRFRQTKFVYIRIPDNDRKVVYRQALDLRKIAGGNTGSRQLLFHKIVKNQYNFKRSDRFAQGIMKS